MMKKMYRSATTLSLAFLLPFFTQAQLGFKPVSNPSGVTSVGQIDPILFYGNLSNGQKVLIDTSGREMSAKYTSIRTFENGVAVVTTGKSFTSSSRSGLINRKGELVLQPEYTDILSVDNLYLTVCKDGKYGVMKNDGSMVLPLEYENLTPVVNNRVGFKTSEGWGIMTLKKEILVKPSYGGKIRLGNFYFVNISGSTYNFYSLPGEKPLILDGRDSYDVLSQVICKKEGSWHVINAAGKELGTFDEFRPLSNNYFIGKEKNASSVKLYNGNGKAIMDIPWPEVRDYSNGFLIFKKDGKYGLADSTGKELLPPNYTYIRSITSGLAEVELGGIFGYADKTGKMVIPPQFSYVSEGIGPKYASGIYDGSPVIYRRKGPAEMKEEEKLIAAGKLETPEQAYARARDVKNGIVKKDKQEETNSQSQASLQAFQASFGTGLKALNEFIKNINKCSGSDCKGANEMTSAAARTYSSTAWNQYLTVMDEWEKAATNLAQVSDPSATLCPGRTGFTYVRNEYQRSLTSFHLRLKEARGYAERIRLPKDTYHSVWLKQVQSLEDKLSTFIPEYLKDLEKKQGAWKSWIDECTSGKK